MKNTHLSKLLLTLTTKELKLLKKWVASPFFNQRTDVIQLLDLYLKRRKKQQTFPSKQEIFNHLYPNEYFDDHRIRMVMSFLNRQVERFLIHQKQQQELLIDKLALLTIYRERALEKPYKRVAKEVEKTFERTPLRNANYYRLKGCFYQEQFEFESLTKRFELKNSLQAILDNLDINILLEKFRKSIIALDHQKIAVVKYDLGLYNKLVESLEDNPSLLNNPTIATYHAASLMISHDTRNYFDSYYKLLEKNHAIFSKEEKFMFYMLATNFLGRNPTIENTIESFVIYQRQVELGLYDEKIAHYAFKNIIGAGLISKAYDWIEQFIEDYGPKLAKEHQRPMTNLARSALDWRLGRYEKALKLLESTKFKDPYLNIAARQTTTKILYELKDWETLQNHLKAFEIFVRRLKDAGYDKSIHLEFVLFAQKIFRIKPNDKKEKNKLIQTLKNSSTILDREWLLKCLNNI